MTRWWQRLFGAIEPEPLDPTRSDLVVVAECFDDSEACSTTLSRASALKADEPALLRHHLRIPPDRIDDVCAVAAQEGYAAAPRSQGPYELESLILQRVQLLDALHCSQERNRMVGLAQRHDGVVDGWDALQPGSATTQR
ncbi:hypothetical protein ACIBG0_37565 [Nocardia sp. NPDC050630]|uniref:hypothetical protein n=1 Tax=Nocardia sp. NPDC050630 TaxID=3364321 RepID=UPI00378FB032